MPQRPRVSADLKVHQGFLRIIPGLLARTQEPICRELAIRLRSLEQDRGHVLGDDLPQDTQRGCIARKNGDSGLACASEFFGFFFTDEAGAGFLIHLRCRVVMGIFYRVLDDIFGVCAIFEYFIGVELTLAHLRMLGGISLFGELGPGLGERVNACDGYFRDRRGDRGHILGATGKQVGGVGVGARANGMHFKEGTPIAHFAQTHLVDLNT